MQGNRIWGICVGLIWLSALLVFAVFAESFAEFGSAAPQAEAKRNLMHIYTLQKVFYEDNGRYGSLTGSGCELNEIGFKQVNCDRARYEYFLTINDTGTGFVATARERVIDGLRSTFPDCNEPLDEWKIDEQRNLRNVFQADGVCARSNASVFKLPSLGATGVGVLGCLVLLMLFCLLETISAIFLPAGASTKKMIFQLSFVSPPWVVLGMLLVTHIMVGPFFTSKFLLSTSGFLMVFAGFFFSRWMVVRALLLSQRRKLAVIAAVPGLVFLTIVLLTIVPGLT